MLSGLVGVCVGTYALLDTTAPRWLALPMLLGGLVVAGLGLLSAGSRVHRTRYRPDRWRWPELVVVAGGLVVAAGGWWVSGQQLPLAYPALDVVPQVSVVALTTVVVGLGAALCAPHQPRTRGVRP